MEQRIGSKSQPLDAAAVNPAHIPGLTPSVSETKSETKSEPESEPDGAVSSEEPASDEAVAEETEADAEASDDDTEAEAEESAAEETDAEEAAPSEESEGSEDSEESSEEEADPDGPVFEASDRRASIKADHSGVRLRLDDQEAEFRWDEIGAVETETPRFGKRFTITVYTPEKRWYPIEIEAKARTRFKEWETELDAVLDAYFEE
ncbi:hypothetical protein AB5J56_16915 [Streptomyces sp. R21]|uniref:Uncharacterized protein n=1 Tax=Streptomyces sp. R21 TaxID=3238627 RepID=A0AB39P7B8_9ACTN